MLKAFTLIELLIVIALLGILSSIGVVTFTGHIASSHKKKAEITINTIYLAQSEYQSNNSKYCISDCNSTANIVNNLLDGADNLSDQKYDFTITGTDDTQTYIIQARSRTSNNAKGDRCKMTIKQNGAKAEHFC